MAPVSDLHERRRLPLLPAAAPQSGPPQHYPGRSRPNTPLPRAGPRGRTAPRVFCSAVLTTSPGYTGTQHLRKRATLRPNDPHPAPAGAVCKAKRLFSLFVSPRGGPVWIA